MRNSALAITVLLATLLALTPGASPQQGGPDQGAPKGPKPGLEVPLITPGPGWKACPRCENSAYIARDRKKANVDTRRFDAHDLSGVWSGDPTDLEANGTLLDHTMVLLTSNLGNASAHDNKNMPVIFAGGRFRLCQYRREQ